MVRRHLRDVPVRSLSVRLEDAGLPAPERLAGRLAMAIHGRGALDWHELGVGRKTLDVLREQFDFGPQLEPVTVRTASDGTRKYAFALRTGEVIEAVLIRNLKSRTICLSSQAGCAMGCVFCATGELGLLRHMTAGEITEARRRVEQESGERITDAVFMGMGEPLHNYEPVVDACANLNAPLALPLGRKRITVSTSGLVPAIRRFSAERQPYRLHLSLHSAIQETRERIMPIARLHPLGDLLDAMRDYQSACEVKWITLQYVALPDVNMDDDHVDALAAALTGLRAIVNVIPWNDTGAAFRAPTWAEVKDFTSRLRRLRCPVKIRYSAGKQEGMGCGQLSAETVAATPTGGHMLAPPGIFTS